MPLRGGLATLRALSFTIFTVPSFRPFHIFPPSPPFLFPAHFLPFPLPSSFTTSPFLHLHLSYLSSEVGSLNAAVGALGERNYNLVHYSLKT